MSRRTDTTTRLLNEALKRKGIYIGFQPMNRITHTKKSKALRIACSCKQLEREE